MVVGNGVRLETVVELELDHNGYVVCQIPSSYLVEDTEEGEEVMVFEVDVEFEGLVKVEVRTEGVAIAEACSVVIGEVMVIVCFSDAVMVTVATAGVMVIT